MENHNPHPHPPLTPEERSETFGLRQGIPAENPACAAFLRWATGIFQGLGIMAISLLPVLAGGFLIHRLARWLSGS